MNNMKIINPGFLTTIQDMGRVGYQKFGVPAAGAMDTWSMQLANILVGNHRNEGVLEITMTGPSIEFNDNQVIALTGATFDLTINKKKVEMNKTIYVAKGDILRINRASNGMRAYLSLAGGFKVPIVMGSKSTYLRSVLGGFKGRKLRAGDILEINQDKNNKYLGIRELPKDLLINNGEKATLRVVIGPEHNLFTDKGIKTFFEKEYILSNQCDRMGYRLCGEKIEHTNGADIISSGITLGAIQVPGHGEPIIMMADRQTTGGYPKIANVITADIPILAQLKPGDKIRFKKIGIDESHYIINEKEKILRDLIKYFDLHGTESIGRVRNFHIGVKGKKFNITLQEIK